MTRFRLILDDGSTLYSDDDATDEIHERTSGDQRAILAYHRACIANTIETVGSIGRIVELGRVTADGRLIETLIQNGRRL